MSELIETTLEKTFRDFNLIEPLQQAIDKKTYIQPTPIQSETIPHFLTGKDIIGKAKTGTGKTAAFALPILNRLEKAAKGPQAIILAPTRELALQVAEQFIEFSEFLKHVSIAILCGGQDYRKQIRQLNDGAQVVVGTPGRILDHINRGTLNLSSTKVFVLDEADEMLRMGFIEDVENILDKTPDNRQIALFSATMPTRIRQIASNYLKNPISIDIASNTETVTNIDQRFIAVKQSDKEAALLRFLAYENFTSAIVFVRTKNAADDVASALQKQNYRAMPLHGDMSQALRDRSTNDFRQGLVDILVATDVAARGLDVERVTHVFNFDAPHDSETYVHRIGRTGRAGRYGKSFLFLTHRDLRQLNFIERHTKQRIQKVNVPTDDMINEAIHTHFFADITHRIDSPFMDEYKEKINDYVEKYALDPIDVATALAILYHQDKPFNSKTRLPKVMEDNGQSRRSANENLVRSRGGRDRSEGARGRNESNRDRSDGRRGNYQDKGIHRDSHRKDDSTFSKSRRTSIRNNEICYRIEVGKTHGVKPKNIVGAIANEAGINSRDIGSIDIFDDYTTLMLPSNLEKNVIRHIQKARVCGRQLNATPVA
jgi:ATP-dependent RNA helicase DeaD